MYKTLNNHVLRRHSYKWTISVGLLHIWVGMNLSIFILLAIYTGNKQIELFIRVLSRLKYDASNLSPDLHVHPYKSH